MNRFVPVFAGIVLIGLAPSAKADFIVSASDIVLAPGSTGFMDVTIRSTPGTSKLDTFGIEFRIETVLGSHRLEFVNPPSDTQLFDAAYIFAGDSAAASVGPPSGIISTFSAPQDTYLGGDGTLSGTGVDVSSTARLLVRLELSAITSSGPVAGDVFSLSLVSSANTFFRDPVFNDIDFLSVPGTVTIGGAPSAVVPEPSSILLFTIGGCAVLLGRFRLANVKELTTEDGRHDLPPTTWRTDIAW
jgi:hypothetical protein